MCGYEVWLSSLVAGVRCGFLLLCAGVRCGFLLLCAGVRCGFLLLCAGVRCGFLLAFRPCKPLPLSLLCVVEVEISIPCSSRISDFICGAVLMPVRTRAGSNLDYLELDSIWIPSCLHLLNC